MLNENFLTSEPVILPINILEAENGLIRKTYLGKWESCSQMVNQSFKEENVVYNFKIDSNNKDNFGHVFSGYLSIE